MKQQTFVLFDEWIADSRALERDEALGEVAQRIVPGGNGMFLPTIVRDGEVVGTWKRTLSSRGVTLASGPFAASSDRLKRGFERAGRRYAGFLETKPVFALLDLGAPDC